MFKELILKLRSALATLALNDVQKKDIEDQIKALETEADKKPPVTPKQEAAVSAGLDEATRQLIASLEGKVNGLTDALNNETKLRKEQADAVAAQAKADREKKVKDFIEKMKKEGRMTAAQETKDKTNLEKDFDAWSEEISARAVNPAMKKGNPEKPAGDGNKGASDQPANYFTNKKSFIDAAIEELKSSTN